MGWCHGFDVDQIRVAGQIGGISLAARRFSMASSGATLKWRRTYLELSGASRKHRSEPARTQSASMRRHTMIERLARALEHIEELTPEAQEDLAEQIAELTSPLDVELDHGTPKPGQKNLPKRSRRALAVFGIARYIEDDEFEALDRIRHSS